MTIYNTDNYKGCGDEEESNYNGKVYLYKRVVYLPQLALRATLFMTWLKY